MQIVIDIPEEVYEDIMAHYRESPKESKSANYFTRLVLNGTPLPKGHGRLIDADKLKENILCQTFGLRSIDIDNAPTIIEADKEDK